MCFLLRDLDLLQFFHFVQGVEGTRILQSFFFLLLQRQGLFPLQLLQDPFPGSMVKILKQGARLLLHPLTGFLLSLGLVVFFKFLPFRKHLFQAHLARNAALARPGLAFRPVRSGSLRVCGHGADRFCRFPDPVRFNGPGNASGDLPVLRSIQNRRMFPGGLFLFRAQHFFHALGKGRLQVHGIVLSHIHGFHLDIHFPVFDRRFFFLCLAALVRCGNGVFFIRFLPSRIPALPLA